MFYEQLWFKCVQVCTNILRATVVALRWHGSVERGVESCAQVEVSRVAAVEDFAGVVGFLGQAAVHCTVEVNVMTDTVSEFPHSTVLRQRLKLSIQQSQSMLLKFGFRGLRNTVPRQLLKLSIQQSQSQLVKLGLQSLQSIVPKLSTQQSRSLLKKLGFQGLC